MSRGRLLLDTIQCSWPPHLTLVLSPQRVDAAKARIESLNPLVAVETLHDPSLLDGDGLDNLIQRVDLVCVTDWDREGLVSCRDSQSNCLFSLMPVRYA